MVDSFIYIEPPLQHLQKIKKQEFDFITFVSNASMLGPVLSQCEQGCVVSTHFSGPIYGIKQKKRKLRKDSTENLLEAAETSRQNCSISYVDFKDVLVPKDVLKFLLS